MRISPPLLTHGFVPHPEAVQQRERTPAEKPVGDFETRLITLMHRTIRATPPPRASVKGRRGTTIRSLGEIHSLSIARSLQPDPDPERPVTVAGFRDPVDR